MRINKSIWQSINPLDYNKPTEEKEVPLPPSNVNPETGEVAEVPDGTLDGVTMLYKAFVLGDWNYEWCFLMSRWWETYGRKLITDKHGAYKLRETIARRERINKLCGTMEPEDPKWFIRDNGIVG